MAAKSVFGAQIGLAIPVAEVNKLLNGRPGEAKVKLGKTVDNHAELSIEVPVADPWRPAPFPAALRPPEALKRMPSAIMTARG